MDLEEGMPLREDPDSTPEDNREAKLQEDPHQEAPTTDVTFPHVPFLNANYHAWLTNRDT